jgi:hypothetical protein
MYMLTDCSTFTGRNGVTMAISNGGFITGVWDERGIWHEWRRVTESLTQFNEVISGFCEEHECEFTEGNNDSVQSEPALDKFLSEFKIM